MDAKWKQHERNVAALIDGRRYPANSGAALDAEGPRFVAQCKLLKRCSLEDLTVLAETVDTQGRQRGKLGIVAAKVRRGPGVASPVIIVMTQDVFAALLRESPAPGAYVCGQHDERAQSPCGGTQ